MVPQRHRMVMHLQLVRGSSSFTAAGDDAARGARGGEEGHPIIMEAEVWGKLPEEMIWEVLLLLPAGKHFQLQLVSRKRRQVLTSTHFRNRVVAAAAGRRGWEQQQQQRAVAWVRVAHDMVPHYTRSSASRHEELKVVEVEHLKAVEIELSGFVPTQFWKSDWYSVVAAGDGLVCICNDSERYHEWTKKQAEAEKAEPLRLFGQVVDDSVCRLPIFVAWKKWRLRELAAAVEAAEQAWEPNCYCVLNQVTRTCVVLPPLPFQPHKWYPPTSTGGGLTISISTWSGTAWELATYHHHHHRASTGGAGGRWVVARKPVANLWTAPPGIAQLGGETYRYPCGDGRVHVLAAAAGDYEDEVEVAHWTPPRSGSMTLLGWESVTLAGLPINFTHKNAVLVAHSRCGAVSLVAEAGRRFPVAVRRAFSVWRLARQRMEWEGVACLDVKEVERDVSAGHFQPPDSVRLDDAYAVRQWMCCQLRVHLKGVHSIWLLVLDLDTGKWKLGCTEEGLMPPQGHGTPCGFVSLDRIATKVFVECASGLPCEGHRHHASLSLHACKLLVTIPGHMRT